MPTNTPLGQSPYFDDYSDGKDFAKILFKPGVSVQVRELNQLQTMFQRQVERFGDNVLKAGTIVSGCSFVFYPSYPYVKIEDVDLDGSTAVVSKYKGNRVVCVASGLEAAVLDALDGFESTDPDLKTLYLRYRNAGDSGELTAFSPGDELVVKDVYGSVYKIAVVDGSTGFSNQDTVIVSPRLVVNVASGTVSNGDYVLNNRGANVHVVGVDTATLASKNQVVLTVRPRDADLANGSSNAAFWTFSSGEAFVVAGNTAAGKIEGIVGSGLRASVLTDGSGVVRAIPVLDGGLRYAYPPTVSVRSPNNASGVGSLSTVARNYVARLKVASVANAVGNGYAFSVSDGVVYQKGYFSRVGAQSIVVSRYGTKPDAVCAGFSTVETVVDSNVDTSLLDPAAGTDNAGAPGADRLKLTPVLTLASRTDAEANADFFTLVEWSEGNPFRQNQTTAYNQIEAEMARRTAEESGDYVVDSFLLTTRSPVDSTKEATSYSAVVDPGTAYVGGHRVATATNFALDVDKPTDVSSLTDHALNLNYGSYVRVSELGGVFQYNTGDVVDFYDTPKGFLSNVSLVRTANVTPVGSKIGAARLRSLVLESGAPGSNAAVYRAHLFDVSMSAGKSFESVRSLAYNGTLKGIADAVLELGQSSADPVAVLREPSATGLLFPTGVESLKSATDVQYLYRTLDQSATCSNSGIVTKDISSSPSEFFPYSGSLSAAEMSQLYLVPVGADIVSSANVTGTVSVNTTSPNAVGTSTTFLTDLRAGDHVYAYANGTAYQTKRVVAVVNNTLAILDSNCSFSNATAGLARTFPAQVPVPLGYRSGLSANVDVNQNVLRINLGISASSATTSNVVLGYNVRVANAAPLTKTPHRSQFVKIALANSEGGTTGPWTLGAPDVFRLRGVYVGNSSVDGTGYNAVSGFYVDHNQNPDFLDLSYLYQAPQTGLTLSSDQYLLAEFDYFTTSGAGFCDAPSYVSSNAAQRALVDSQPLSNLTSAVASWEVPEVFDDSGREYDLLQYFDFRPRVANTAAPSSTAGGAPVNPPSTRSFGNTASVASEKRFPVPGGQMLCSVDQYLGRSDTVVIDSTSTIRVLKGPSDANPARRVPPAAPAASLKIGSLAVPAYPSLSVTRGTAVSEVLNTRVASGKFSRGRANYRTIAVVPSANGPLGETPRAYTMADIGNIDRRLRDVEYYVTLSVLEQKMASLAIPSSNDPTLNRFKYGFFADDYSTYDFLDANVPTFAADVEDGALVPSKLMWDVTMSGSPGGPSYVDKLVCSQDNATWPDTLGPVCTLQYMTYHTDGNTVHVVDPRGFVSAASTLDVQVTWVQDPVTLKWTPTVPAGSETQIFDFIKNYWPSGIS